MMKIRYRLTDHLRDSGLQDVRLTFAELERLFDETFPASARKYNAWWSNNPSNNPRTQAWLDAGYATRDLDLVNETVLFTKSSN